MSLAGSELQPLRPPPVFGIRKINSDLQDWPIVIVVNLLIIAMQHFGSSRTHARWRFARRERALELSMPLSII
jgi:hypothetical protein